MASLEKIDLSLDDIIKLNKKAQRKTQKVGVKGSQGRGRGTRRGALRGQVTKQGNQFKVFRGHVGNKFFIGSQHQQPAAGISPLNRKNAQNVKKMGNITHTHGQYLQGRQSFINNNQNYKNNKQRARKSIQNARRTLQQQVQGSKNRQNVQVQNSAIRSQSQKRKLKQNNYGGLRSDALIAERKLQKYQILQEKRKKQQQRRKWGQVNQMQNNGLMTIRFANQGRSNEVDITVDQNIDSRMRWKSKGFGQQTSDSTFLQAQTVQKEKFNFNKVTFANQGTSTLLSDRFNQMQKNSEPARGRRGRGAAWSSANSTVIVGEEFTQGELPIFSPRGVPSQGRISRGRGRGRGRQGMRGSSGTTRMVFL